MQCVLGDAKRESAADTWRWYWLPTQWQSHSGESDYSSHLLVSIRVRAFFWKMNSAIFVLHFSQKNGWPWEGPPTESRFVAAWAHLWQVIDEADRILDFGFQETMHNILQHLPSERQTSGYLGEFCFFATSSGQESLSGDFIKVHIQRSSLT